MKLFCCTAMECQYVLCIIHRIKRIYCYNAVSPKGTCIVNAYCQFSQQACTNFMQTYLYSLISTHFFILTTNLHCSNTSSPELPHSLKTSLTIHEICTKIPLREKGFPLLMQCLLFLRDSSPT